MSHLRELALLHALAEDVYQCAVDERTLGVHTYEVEGRTCLWLMSEYFRAIAVVKP